MKLSFSLAKSAAPKRKVDIQHIEQQDTAKREVVQVSQVSGVRVEKTEEDIALETQLNLSIPVKTLYEKPSRPTSQESDSREGDLKALENKSGIIGGRKKECSGNSESETPPRKKKSGSILMQIRAAREKGLIQDAPESTSKSFDPEQFGWALLRGMGYDPTTDSTPDVTQTVVGNQGRLGLGVKREMLHSPRNSNK